MFDDKVPVGSGDSSFLFLLAIDEYLKLGDVSCGKCFMGSHFLYQYDWDLNNADASFVNGFINSHTLSQCNDSSIFKDMDGDAENGDVSGGHGSMNSHTVYQ